MRLCRSGLLFALLIASPAPSIADDGTILPSALTCVWTELPAERPIVTIEDDAGMRAVGPFLAVAETTCAARHGWDQESRNRALSYAFIQHEMAVAGRELTAVGASAELLRGHFVVMNDAARTRLRERRTVQEDGIAVFRHLERAGVFRAIGTTGPRVDRLADASGRMLVLLDEEAVLLAAVQQAR